MFKKLLNTLTAQSQQDRDAKLYRSLIHREAKLGGQVFGPVPAGHRREFFCLDKHTWVWHEEWQDANGQHQVVTTRYDVRPGGVLKSQNGSNYQPLSRDEAINLWQAAQKYYRLTREQIYSQI